MNTVHKFIQKFRQSSAATIGVGKKKFFRHLTDLRRIVAARTPALRLTRARYSVLFALGVLMLAEFITLFQPFWSQPTYALGSSASSLLTPTNQSMAERVKFNQEKQVYTFNDGYVASPKGVMQTAGPRITATAHQTASDGLTVTDPTYNTSFTLKPQFNLLPGKQTSNRIIYPLGMGAAKGWLVYGMHSTSVKEDVVLTESPGDKLELEYELELKDGMEARQEINGSIGIYGNQLLMGDVATGSEKDAQLLEKARQNAEKNTLLFTIPAPVVIETGKKKSDIPSHFELSGTTLKVVTTGLKDASYPLSIDPSIYVETAEKFMRGNNETNIDFDVQNTLIQKGQTTGARFDELSSTTSLPENRWGHGTAVAGGYAYVVGGNNGTSNQASVYWSKFNTTTAEIDSPNPGQGACASWCTNGGYDLPSARKNLSLVAYNGYLYALGGEDASCTTGNGTGANGICDTAYVAKLGANGEPQLWHPTDTNQNNWDYWYQDADLSSPRSMAAAVAYNNHMYLLGGKTDTAAGGITTVESVNLNPDGTLTPWSTTGMTTLPSVRFGHGAHTYNDRLYLVGGNSNGILQNTVNYITINADGSLVSNWSSANDFKIPRMSWGVILAQYGADTCTYQAAVRQ